MPRLLSATIRQGGGVQDWVWKGASKKRATCEAYVDLFRSTQLRHTWSFSEYQQSFRFDSEAIEDGSPDRSETLPFFSNAEDNPLILFEGEELYLSPSRMPLRTAEGSLHFEEGTFDPRGGDSKDLRIRCREGFRKLIDKAGFSGRMPGITACGSRRQAFDGFKAALLQRSRLPILLVDSEDLIERKGGDAAWLHLSARDRWDRPPDAFDDQAQLMVTSMETWMIADQVALRRFFGSRLKPKPLPRNGLETRSRGDVRRALEQATRDCRGGGYRKGSVSFRLLAELDPEELKGALPHFQRFLDALQRRLSPGIA